MQVTIFTANCVGQAGNCSYPNKVTVVTLEQLQEAVKKDHVCGVFKGNYRSIDNFIRSDVIVKDIDNDHSEEPTEWITPEKLEELFPNVEYLLAPSCHHLLDKEGKSARPRYHVYFSISEITDAARFIFGAEFDEVILHDGWMTVDVPKCFAMHFAMFLKNVICIFVKKIAILSLKRMFLHKVEKCVVL